MIELQTNLAVLIGGDVLRCHVEHDALAAHAYGLALEEARLKWRVQVGQYAWVSDRAAAILAELLLAGKEEV